MTVTCTDPLLTCPSPVLPMSQGYRPAPISTGECCDGFRDENAGRQEPCCDRPVYEIVSCATNAVCCPEGSVPATPNIVMLAKHSPLFSGLFGCYPEDELYRYLCCMEQYRLPGCENGDLAVLFAAAHFFTMQTSIHRNMQGTMVVQATEGDPIEPIALPTHKGIRPGDEQWLMTSYGIQYKEQFKRPVVAVLGMAWGI